MKNFLVQELSHLLQIMVADEAIKVAHGGSGGQINLHHYNHVFLTCIPDLI
jgi:hypothetical protein